MKTIELNHDQHGTVAEAIKNLILILAGSAALSFILILAQPLSHLQYRYDPHLATASLSAGMNLQPGNNNIPTASAVSLAAAVRARPPEAAPPGKDKTPLNPAPAIAPVSSAATMTASVKTRATVAHATAGRLRKAAEMQAFLEENERRNDSIVQQLSLVIDMHECHFGRASAEPVNDSLMGRLDSSVEKCIQSPAGWSRIIVLGFTDNRGDRVTNIKLGMVRAEKLKAFLVGKGIPAEKITTASFGPALPIDNNNTESGRARNRRAELNVLGLAANAGL